MGVNLLQTTGNERGPVSSRVALLLRSAEGKPLFYDFCFPLTSGSMEKGLGKKKWGGGVCIVKPSP